MRRLQFRSILAASESHLTVDRYLRLIALAVGDGLLLLFSVAFLLGIVFSDLDQFEFSEYKSWDTVHAGFSVISQIPEETLAPSVYANFVISFYTVPIYSFLFFTFFGLGEEATADYVRAFRRLQCHAAIVGLCKPPSVRKAHVSEAMLTAQSNCKPSRGASRSWIKGRPVAAHARQRSPLSERATGLRTVR